ncbi:MAG: phosphoenolpyruvate--protein phosphotransferase [Desulfobacterales bacterium]|nr:phosphoenolpyruvate--protein phosphotransferase [Desulfobacterales bacterium]
MPKKLNLFADICRLMTDSKSPQKTLETIVMLVAGRLGIDVCSVYLFDEHRKHLVLRATYGLNAAAVETIRMSPQEGLTGLVVEHQEPVLVVNPQTHPRFKFFENSGEEVYKIFFGLPLVYHQQSLGVIVFQSLNETAISETDIPLFTSIASQIAATVAYTGLLENLAKERTQRENLENKLKVADPLPPVSRAKKTILRGIPVCAGFAEGHAHYLPEGIGFDQVACTRGGGIKSEKKRLEIALSRTLEEMKTLIAQLDQLPPEETAIFESHLMVINDPSFKKRIAHEIETGSCAEYALKQVVEKLMAQFMSIEDPYLKERSADIEDIGKRVLRNLIGAETLRIGALSEDTILVASDISAVDLITLLQPKLKGIALSRGGRTSHAAILSKSFEIPMVIGLSEILETIKENDFLILDGTSGLLFKEPTEEIVKEYQRLKAEKEQDNRQLDSLRELPAITRDGRTVPLDVNIGLLSDTELVKKYGGDHIGLYRTEFPFLARKSFPTEMEQAELYARVLTQVNGKSLTIRTLDVGGDKFLSYLDYPKEQNPYLGWRSIRVCLEMEEIFRPQIRAILRTSAHGPVKLLFPMVCSLKEADQILQIVEAEKNTLAAMNVPFDPRIPIGTMIEVPAAAVIIKHLLTRFDFASIGTNDLIQYTLAVDRNNPKVAHLYNPLHPAVLSLINTVIQACTDAGKEISICGEAAANPKCAFLFAAMGANRLSMSPSAIPMIKKLIREMDYSNAQVVLSTVLQMGSEEDIGVYMDQAMNDIEVHHA